MDQETQQHPLKKLPQKHQNSLRFTTFNINGSRTLFHYFPWNQLRNYNSMFMSLETDIITLQELKLNPSDIDHSIGNLSNYKSFISLPKTKKGYSGVGVFVKIPNESDSELMKRCLTVIRAEEGITGILQSPDNKTKRYRDLPAEQSIGGYPDLPDEKIALELDSQGRCVVIELAVNLVIISLYCPANSMGTEEGEVFRLLFLKKLFERVVNLKQMGKEVLVMGDINVSPDLIDNAVGITDRYRQGLLNKVSGFTNDVEEGELFEQNNKAQVIFFKGSQPHRLLLNEHLCNPIETDTNHLIPFDPFKNILYDVVRLYQGRRMRIYTVWNTITNSRPGNYGSRIDLILPTKVWYDITLSAGIWQWLMGSDHCPVYTDFDICKLDTSSFPEISDLRKFNPRFEAKYYFRLLGVDISMMFGKRKITGDEVQANNLKEKEKEVLKDAEKIVKKPKLVYTSRKKPIAKPHQSISNFFFKQHDPSQEKPADRIGTGQDAENENKDDESSQEKETIINSIESLNSVYGKPPCCKHDEPAILKTSLTKTTKGRKFWCCNRNIGDSNNEKYRCDFFQWLK